MNLRVIKEMYIGTHILCIKEIEVPNASCEIFHSNNSPHANNSPSDRENMIILHRPCHFTIFVQPSYNYFSKCLCSCKLVQCSGCLEHLIESIS